VPSGRPQKSARVITHYSCKTEKCKRETSSEETPNNFGKVVVNKTPPGARSPNFADAVMIAFSPSDAAMEIWRKLGAAED
jgi:hypothetical protein